MNQTYKGKLDWQKRYCEAHYGHYQRNYPAIIADGLYCLPVMPKVATANGLTKFIVNYLDWTGCHGNRIAAMGRMIKQGKDIVTAIGTIKAKTVMIPGATKKGTADITGLIGGDAEHFGIHCEIEVKIGKDRQSVAQKTFEQKITGSGGLYVIVKTVDEFLSFYDKVMAMPKTKKILL